VTVPFMNKTTYWYYAEDDTTQAVAIPLSGSAVEFVVFLPKTTSSLAQFEDSLAQGHAQTLLASMTSQDVKLALPKFAFTTASVRLSSAAGCAGNGGRLRPEVPTSPASPKRSRSTSLTLSTKPWWGWTRMVSRPQRRPPSCWQEAAFLPTRKHVTVNRPFFFGIYDQPTSTWLFLGHVTDPS
jgi:serine protease inhibitor